MCTHTEFPISDILEVLRWVSGRVGCWLFGGWLAHVILESAQVLWVLTLDYGTSDSGLTIYMLLILFKNADCLRYKKSQSVLSS